MNPFPTLTRTQRSFTPIQLRRFASAIIAALALGFATTASATLIDFNSGSADLTDNFTEFGQTAGTNFVYSSAAGIGSGGGVSVSGYLDSLHYNTPLAGFSEGTTSIELSVFYRARSAVGGNADTSIVLGLVTDTSVTLGSTSTAPTTSWLSLHIQAQNSPGEQTYFQASFRGRNGGAGLTGGGSSGTFQVVHNNWYKFTTVFTYDMDAETFSATALIQDYGASGLSETPTTVLSFSSNMLANLSLAEAEQLFASIRTGAPNAAGSNALDNFSVSATAVPEPASAALAMALAGLCCAIVLRRQVRAVGDN